MEEASRGGRLEKGNHSKLWEQSFNAQFSHGKRIRVHIELKARISYDVGGSGIVVTGGEMYAFWFA